MRTREALLKEQLALKQQNNSLRSLKVSQGIDFSSNDYLGFARSPAILENFKAKTSELNQLGSTGSRLLNGHTPRHAHLEALAAKIFKAESALLFSSGYTCNLGLIQCLADDQTVLILDELCHNSLKNGAKLSGAKTLLFRHNDLNHLEQRLSMNQGKRCLIVIESVYSMDGDLAPLAAMITLAKQYQAEVIIDEAHGAGVLGSHGEGLVGQLHAEQDILARVVTFGKAFGAEGAVVLGSQILKEYLVNFSQPFIYTTGVSMPQLLMLESVLEYFKSSQTEIKQLHANLQAFTELQGVPVPSPIYTWRLDDHHKARSMAQKMQAEGLNIFPILSPTVRRGTERLRIVIHAYNTLQELQLLTQMMRTYAE